MRPIPSLRERELLGPARCQGCGGLVVYLALGSQMLGWLHANGSLRCPKPGPKPRHAT
jgi:hypothetical protein